MSKIDIATGRLTDLADEFDHPLSALLEWFSDPLDMEDLGTWPIHLVRQSVLFYIDNYEQFRRKSNEATNQPNQPTEGRLL